MSDIEQTFCLMGLIVCLGVCFVWALYEIEAWRQQHGGARGWSATPCSPWWPSGRTRTRQWS